MSSTTDDGKFQRVNGEMLENGTANDLVCLVGSVVSFSAETKVATVKAADHRLVEVVEVEGNCIQ